MPSAEEYYKMLEQLLAESSFETEIVTFTNDIRSICEGLYRITSSNLFPILDKIKAIKTLKKIALIILNRQKLFQVRQQELQQYLNHRNVKINLEALLEDDTFLTSRFSKKLA